LGANTFSATEHLCEDRFCEFHFLDIFFFLPNFLMGVVHLMMRPHCLEIHFEEGRGGEKTPIGEQKKNKVRN
jgi:hypothetical protein